MVDDLLAIAIIAVFYIAELAVLPLLGAVVPLAVFAVLVQRRVRSWWLLLPLCLATWALVHASGVHAAVAGALLAFSVPVIRSDQAGGPDAGPGRALRAPLPAHLRRHRRTDLRVAIPLASLSVASTVCTPP